MPGGLIHHWIGAVFVPNVKLDDVFDVTRDYDYAQALNHGFWASGGAVRSLSNVLNAFSTGLKSRCTNAAGK